MLLQNNIILVGWEFYYVVEFTLIVFGLSMWSIGNYFIDPKDPNSKKNKWLKLARDLGVLSLCVGGTSFLMNVGIEMSFLMSSKTALIVELVNEKING